MNAIPAYDKYLTFINTEIQPRPRRSHAPMKAPRWRALTISRQTGSGGRAVAEHLLPQLDARLPGKGRPWTIFDRNLVGKVLEDHHLPARLAQFMPEDRVSEMRDTIDELFGLHPPSWTLVRQTSETILRLVDLGNVIILGRGANVITSSLDYVFNVRLAGTLEKRVENVQHFQNLHHKAARDLILREDRGRARYLKKHFDADIDDPLLYHLVINTDDLTPEEIARIVFHAMAPAA